ncbi:jg6175 [Pararge aegeria aegeria]|uniref:Jg6175 protein n=1 Tax=Pararge aegeria aegeria TaxID=348720 RepID=A0A8S4RTG8_9NEOP|nr:jg6175 [Pararge aegeria aegeria]
MASANSECDLTSMFMQRGDGKRVKSPTRSESASRRSSLVKPNLPAEVITVKDFFDFMKTAYQVYEHLEGEEDEGSKINWEELTKLTVLNHVIEQQERDLLYQTAFSEQKTITSKSDTTIEKKSNDLLRVEKRYSCSEIEGKCSIDNILLDIL